MVNNLKKVRLSKGVTQEELARAIDISLRQIQNIENNKSIPSILIVLKIMEYLKVNDIYDIFYL